MTVHAEAYHRTMQRVRDLAERADPATLVPACPGWTVHDLLAHLAGLAGDWLAGRLDGYGSEPWTARHVEDRRERGLDSILAEWEALAPALRPLLSDPVGAGAPDFAPAIVITDLAAHEHDLRGAVGRPGARSSDAVKIGMQSHVAGLRLHFTSLGLPTLQIDADDHRSWKVGRGETVATWAGSLFELFRATGGRRTRAEVEAMDWSGDRDQFLADLLQRPYGWPARSLHE